MMWVLALDTSSPGGAVALLRDDEVAVERRGDAALSHAQRLPGVVAETLAAAGLEPHGIDLLAVASGPGAFTGLRVGLATVQGLAMALDRPTVGISSLAAAAWRAFGERPDLSACSVWLDAARGDVFAATFGRPVAGQPDWPLVELFPPTVATPESVLQQLRASVPDQAPVLLGPAARGADVLAAAGWPAIAAAAPVAVPVGRIARRIHAAGGSGPPHALTPLYVRRPDAEVERDRRLGVPTAER
jgi:tRNA threonylcarbamoyladenosine biosynthesis protein TsaB